jgi:uncharacterized membrane protein YfcA
LKGLVEPLISLLYLAGGVAGGYAGARAASAVPRRTLRRIFVVSLGLRYRGMCIMSLAIAVDLFVLTSKLQNSL